MANKAEMGMNGNDDENTIKITEFLLKFKLQNNEM